MDFGGQARSAPGRRIRDFGGQARSAPGRRTREVVCGRTADRSLGEVRHTSVATGPTETSRPRTDESRSARCSRPKPGIVLAETRTRVRLTFEVVRVSPPIIGRLRLVGLRRSLPAVSRFRCGSKVFRPMHAGAFPSQHPPPRLHFAFGAPDVERGHPESVVRANADQRTSHGPVSLGLDPSKSPPPACPRRSTPGTLLPATNEFATTSNVPSGRGCQATESRSVHVVSHHLDGFLRIAGSGLVASRYRTWGSLRFSTTKRRKPKFPGGWQDGSVPEGEGVGPDPRSADPSKV
jgi:hypothetical protein